MIALSVLGVVLAGVAAYYARLSAVGYLIVSEAKFQDIDSGSIVSGKPLLIPIIDVSLINRMTSTITITGLLFRGSESEGSLSDLPHNWVSKIGLEALKGRKIAPRASQSFRVPIRVIWIDGLRSIWFTTDCGLKIRIPRKFSRPLLQEINKRAAQNDPIVVQGDPKESQCNSLKDQDK